MEAVQIKKDIPWDSIFSFNLLIVIIYGGILDILVV
jgi:hypothetical protein